MNAREKIKSAKRSAVEWFDVPAWGGKFGIRTLRSSELDAFEDSLRRHEGGKSVTDLENYKARLVARCLVDESGQRVYGDSKEDAAELGEQDAAVIQPLYEAAERLNGRDVQPKNSEAGGGNASS